MRNILLVTLSVLVLSGCSSLQKDPTTTPEPTSESAAVEQVTTESNEIATAFSTGASLKCDVSKEGQPNSHYLVKDKKMKMSTEATTESPDQYFSINDGSFIYIWSSDTTAPGTKLSLEDIKNASDTFDNQFQQFPDINDESVREDIKNSGFTINCAPAEIADSEFVPPANITFNNPMEMFNAMMEKQPAE